MATSSRSAVRPFMNASGLSGRPRATATETPDTRVSIVRDHALTVKVPFVPDSCA
jgi:hypothetical protein